MGTKPTPDYPINPFPPPNPPPQPAALTPLAPEELKQIVLNAVDESAPHRVIEMVDATIRSAYGPQDETISSGVGRDMAGQSSGLKHAAAKFLDGLLNTVSPDHAMKAMVADYVRARMEETRLSLILGGAVTEQIDAILMNPAATTQEGKQ